MSTCGAIRFSGIEVGGAPGIAAERHRRALTALMPPIRSTVCHLAVPHVPAIPLEQNDELGGDEPTPRPLCRRALPGRYRDGTFPQPLRLGPQSIGWWRAEILEWLESLQRAGAALDDGRQRKPARG